MIRPITVEQLHKLKNDEELHVKHRVGTFIIKRESEVMDFLGIPTEMYSVDKFRLIDPLGYELCLYNDAESVVGYMNGLNGFVDEEIQT